MVFVVINIMAFSMMVIGHQPFQRFGRPGVEGFEVEILLANTTNMLDLVETPFMEMIMTLNESWSIVVGIGTTDDHHGDNIDSDGDGNIVGHIPDQK